MSFCKPKVINKKMLTSLIKRWIKESFMYNVHFTSFFPWLRTLCFYLNVLYPMETDLSDNFRISCIQNVSHISSVVLVRKCNTHSIHLTKHQTKSIYNISVILLNDFWTTTAFFGTDLPLISRLSSNAGAYINRATINKDSWPSLSYK